ncbi:hypothetical protein [Mycolicibacterium sp.]|uniref:hypothetical protein n=1 Tax=Mycolicibacterium sp. TaxID=2320850 RepID=UPI00355ECC09
MIRPQAVVLPVLRAALPGVAVVSVVPDVDYRTYPMVSVRRAGGIRNRSLPRLFSQPVLELVAVSAEGLVEAEELYDEALDALYDAVRQQITVEDVGYLHSIRERQGPTQAPSPYPDTWMTEGSVAVGIRQL